jgi:hypothetical protein
MSILRHSKINITMEIYTETTSEPTRDALRSSATGSREPGCCRLLLPEDQKGQFQDRNWPLTCGGAKGI